MPKKRKVYIVPVRLEWDMEIPADNKETAVKYAWQRLGVITAFGANQGRTGKVVDKKARVK